MVLGNPTHSVSSFYIVKPLYKTLSESIANSVYNKVRDLVWKPVIEIELHYDSVCHIYVFLNNR